MYHLIEKRRNRLFKPQKLYEMHVEELLDHLDYKNLLHIDEHMKYPLFCIVLRHQDRKIIHSIMCRGTHVKTRRR